MKFLNKFDSLCANFTTQLTSRVTISLIFLEKFSRLQRSEHCQFRNIFLFKNFQSDTESWLWLWLIHTSDTVLEEDHLKQAMKIQIIKLWCFSSHVLDIFWCLFTFWKWQQNLRSQFAHSSQKAASSCKKSF